ncbi:hypothetical protein Tco_0729179, partial [Tanacetum coccineum]
VGVTRRVASSDDEGLGAQEDASKQGRSRIEAINRDAEVTLLLLLVKFTANFEVTTNVEVTANGEVVTTARQMEEEANIALLKSWDNTQVMIETDFELAQRLQEGEHGEIPIEERSRLFIELIEKRKKHFAALRAQEKSSKPPTKAQKRNIMSTYLKNMTGYKHNQLKRKSYDEIQDMFDKEMKRVNTFVDMNTELVKGIKDDEVAIDAIPLATKPLVIVDYKIDKDGRMGYFKLIRADGSSKRYSSMIKILQGIDREDLETLWKLVKAKYKNTRPKDDYERELWGDLKVMFEPDIKSDVWRNLQGYKVTVFRRLADQP